MITSQTNRTFIESEQYSSFILTNMHDGLLPENFYRNVGDFGSGETLHIKTIGEAQIQEVSEDTPITYTPIETGEVQLRITEYVGDGWYITDKVREDGAQMDALQAQRAKEATRAIQEHFETQALKTLNEGQTDADPNLVNSFAHRVASAETNNVVKVDHFIDMKIAFDKAEVPYAGRVAFVDPVVEATLNGLFQGNYAVDSNAEMQGILEGGFGREHKFVMNLFGWDLMTSNRLDKGDFSDGTTAVTGAVANVFMCIADDQCKSLMTAWRRQPSVEGDRNKDMQRDEYVQTARWGMGIQRTDTLGVLITSATNY